MTSIELEDWRDKFIDGWRLSDHLFGNDIGVDIFDFEINDYNYFLSHVESLEDLRDGLCQLYPLAKDAFDMAYEMNQSEFRMLKRLLPQFKTGAYVSKKFAVILMPKQFIEALMLAEMCQVPLGVAVIRMLDVKCK